MTPISIIGCVVGIIGCLVGLWGFLRNKKTDDKTDGKKDGVILTEIGYIKSGVDDIKRKQDKQDQQHLDVVTKLTEVEQSAKQAHHRIDTIENRLNNRKD